MWPFIHHFRASDFCGQRIRNGRIGKWWHDGFEVNYHPCALTPPLTLPARPMVPAAKPQYAQVIEHHALPHSRRNKQLGVGMCSSLWVWRPRRGSGPA